MATCIIGDIHGCFSSLAALLDLVVDRADTLVFLGDYIDRGPDTKKVVDLLLVLKKEHPRVITLQGNHESILQDYFMGRNESIFLRVGGLQTLKSYGLATREQDVDILTAFPATHRNFLSDLPLLWEDQFAIYVHAGLQPGRPLGMQTADWCLWVRDKFIQKATDFGKPVVFGHTVFKEPLIQTDKIGIDTGAVYGGRLTALLLPDMEFISVPGEQQHPYPTVL